MMRKYSLIFLVFFAGVLAIWLLTKNIAPTGRETPFADNNSVEQGELQQTGTLTSTQSLYMPVVMGEPLGELYDMAQFMIGDGRLYEIKLIRPDDGGESQARNQTQTTTSRFYHTKGNEVAAEWEELWADDDFIYRGTDTSPGDNQYYTLYEDAGSTYGSPWSPRHWRVGDIYERSPLVIFYDKSNCNMAVSGTQTTSLKFQAFHESITFDSGITLENVVELGWIITPGAEPTESYFYAENYGLAGWSSNDRGFSFISEEHAPDARPDNTREEIGCLV